MDWLYLVASILSAIIVAWLIFNVVLRPKPNYRRKFEGKVVVITGASSGIGEELALQLSKFKPKLVLAARRVDRLESLKKTCLSLGAQEVLLMATDVGVKDDCKKLIDETVKKFLTVDVLYCNAGIGMATTLFKCPTPDVLEQVMNTNFNGAVNTTFYALPYLRKSNGHVIVTSSVFAFFVTRGTSAYAASKAALNSFFASVRLEEARNKVKVTVICPGHVATEIQKQSLGADGKPIGSEVGNLGFEVSLKEAAKIMVDATALERWLVVYTHSANILSRVRAVFPEYYDRYITRAMYG
jgi:short-subunit dehydrogenase